MGVFHVFKIIFMVRNCAKRIICLAGCVQKKLFTVKCLAKFGENKLLHLKWANIEASAQLSSEKITKLRVM